MPGQMTDAQRAAALIRRNLSEDLGKPAPPPPQRAAPPPPPPRPQQPPPPRTQGPKGSIASKGKGKAAAARKPRFVPKIAQVPKPQAGKKPPPPPKRESIGGQMKPDDYAKEYMDSFRWLEFSLLILGRWPLSFEKRAQDRKYTWKKFSLRSIYFCVVTVLTVIAWICSIISIYQVFVIQHDRPKDRTPMEILEQALFERHTVFIMMMILHQTMNVITSFLLYQRHEEYQELFTRSIQFAVRSRLRLVEGCYYEVIAVVVVFFLSLFIAFVMAFIYPCASTKGNPTVMSMMLFRWLLPANYLTKEFPGSTLHWIMLIIGIIAIFFILLLSYLYFLVFFWLVRLYRNGWSGWNQRAHACVCRGDKMATVKARTTYELLFVDHCDLQKLTRLLNYVYDFILEFYLFKFTVIICYEAHLAIKSATDGERLLTKFDVGIYFIRPRDYIPALIFTICFLFYISLLMWASCWFEDDAMNGYNIMRRKVFMDGLQSDVQVYFCMTLLQAYTGPTKLRIEAGDYVNMERSNILVMWSLIATMVLVIYQLNPAYDFNTENFIEARKIIGEFLAVFEGLPKDHWIASNVTEGHYKN